MTSVWVILNCRNNSSRSLAARDISAYQTYFSLTHGLTIIYNNHQMGKEVEKMHWYHLQG